MVDYIRTHVVNVLVDSSLHYHAIYVQNKYLLLIKIKKKSWTCISYVFYSKTTIPLVSMQAREHAREPMATGYHTIQIFWLIALTARHLKIKVIVCDHFSHDKWVSQLSRVSYSLSDTLWSVSVWGVHTRFVFMDSQNKWYSQMKN